MTEQNHSEKPANTEDKQAAEQQQAPEATTDNNGKNTGAPSGCCGSCS